MRYYPLFLDLHGTRCLVVGAGNVGCRKLRDLLCAEPREILVLDVTLPNSELQVLLEESKSTPANLRFEQRPVRESDIQGCSLVFAATGNRAVNHMVADTCQKLGVLCNSADAPEEGSFIVPARVSRGRLIMALSSGGTPALTKRLKEEAGQWLGERFVPLAELLARVRPLVLAMGHETGQNSKLFRALVYSSLDEALRQRDRARCKTLLLTLLPPILHPHISELLHGLA